MTYTVQVTVTLSAESEHEAYGFIQHALDHAKQAEIVYLDANVIGARPDDEEQDEATA